MLGWCVDTVANASFHPHVLVIDEVDYLTCGPGATTVAPTGRTPESFWKIYDSIYNNQDVITASDVLPKDAR